MTTNRIPAPFLVIHSGLDSPSVQADLDAIRDILDELRESPTLENAQVILAKGRANKPLAWTVTPEELPALWAELVQAEKA